MDNIVYHYTSPQAALDILKHKKLRFTDCQYLNDASELKYYKGSLNSAIEKINHERVGKENPLRHINIDFPSYEEIDEEWA